MDEPAGIYPAMVEVARAVGSIAKAKRNQQQNFNFRGIDDVYNHVHDILTKNDIFIQTRVREYEVGLIERAGGKPPEVHAHAIFTFVFTHADGSSVSVEMPGESRDYADKASNKAISFAAKYAFISAFTIPTEDQDDGDRDQPAPPTGQGTRPTAQTPPQGGTGAGPSAPQAGSGDSATTGDFSKMAQQQVLELAKGDKKIARTVWDALDSNDRLPAKGDWTRSKYNRVIKEAKAAVDALGAPFEGENNGSE